MGEGTNYRMRFVVNDEVGDVQIAIPIMTVLEDNDDDNMSWPVSWPFVLHEGQHEGHCTSTTVRSFDHWYVYEIHDHIFIVSQYQYLFFSYKDWSKNKTRFDGLFTVNGCYSYWFFKTLSTELIIKCTDKPLSIILSLLSIPASHQIDLSVPPNSYRLKY